MKNLRLELENYVVAWNTKLREVVSTMDIIILLRNSHPAYRDNFARDLLNAKMISKEQASEFLRLVR